MDKFQFTVSFVKLDEARKVMKDWHDDKFTSDEIRRMFPKEILPVASSDLVQSVSYLLGPIFTGLVLAFGPYIKEFKEDMTMENFVEIGVQKVKGLKFFKEDFGIIWKASALMHYRNLLEDQSIFERDNIEELTKCFEDKLLPTLTEKMIRYYLTPLSK